VSLLLTAVAKQKLLQLLLSLCSAVAQEHCRLSVLLLLTAVAHQKVVAHSVQLLFKSTAAVSVVAFNSCPSSQLLIKS
jgi:hypothetical protein